MVYKKEVASKTSGFRLHGTPVVFKARLLGIHLCDPAISRLWTSKEELKETAGSLTSGSERNS